MIHILSLSAGVRKTLSRNKAGIWRDHQTLWWFCAFSGNLPHQTYISNDDKWRLFFLKGAGIWFKRNCLSMPITHAILKRHPNVVSAYISVLGPRKKLNPHIGPYSGVLRLHLALDVPHRQRCYISVNGKTEHWKQGTPVFWWHLWAFCCE